MEAPFNYIAFAAICLVAVVVLAIGFVAMGHAVTFLINLGESALTGFTRWEGVTWAERKRNRRLFERR